MDSLSIYQIRILAAVVQHGSFSRAADALGLTQPAVSAQVSHLRRIAGGPIFKRDGRQIVLTDAGRALYRYAEVMLGATDALREDLAEIVSGGHDRVVVGAAPAYAAYVIPSVLSRFQRTHPSMRFAVVDGLSPDIAERVGADVLDLGMVDVARVPSQVLAKVAAGDLGRDMVVIIEASHQPFSGGEPMTVEELEYVPFVRISGRIQLTRSLDAILAARGLKSTESVMELGTWEGVKDAVRSGAGVAVVLRSVVQRDLERGDLREVETLGLEASRALSLLCSPRRRAEAKPSFTELLNYLSHQIPLCLRGSDPVLVGEPAAG